MNNAEFGAPWVSVLSGKNIIVIPDRNYPIDELIQPICDLGSKDNENAIKNARLIVNSPAMYELLIKAFRCLTRYNLDFSLRFDICDVLNKVDGIAEETIGEKYLKDFNFESIPAKEE